MAVVPNEEQAAAAAAVSGRVLISAGAGSGKTRTLVERFVTALEPRSDEQWEGVGVDEVLAITFTEKAAGELAHRIRMALREDQRTEDARRVDGAWISTIHGFCSRVLRRYALEAGLDPGFAVADTVQTQRLKEHAFEIALEAADARSGVLLADYEYDAVYSAVTELVAHLQSRGKRPASARPEVVRRAHELLEEALQVIAVGRDQVTACGDERANATKLREGCCSAFERLEAIDHTRLSDSEVALEVWRALVLFKPSGTAATVRDIAAALKFEKERLLAQAAGATIAVHVRELLEIAVGYDEEYRRLKLQRSLLDFEDLQLEAMRLLAEQPAVLSELRRHLRLVMVDEFQDTDELQLSLVRAVAGENLCTVGDEQQSIYGFRGADINVYRRHNEQMRASGAREFELNRNYRSHPAILSFVNHVFGRLFETPLIRLHPGREEGAPVVDEATPRVDLTFVRAASRGKDCVDGRPCEAWHLAERLAQLRDTHGVDPGQMVVLLRSYAHSDAYAQALAQRGFPVSVVGGSRFFASPAVVVGRALLATSANPHDDEALAVILASDVSGLSSRALWSVGRARPQPSCTLWDAVVDGVSGLESSDASRLRAVVEAITRSRDRVGACRMSELLLRACEELGYDLELLKRGQRGLQDFANLLKLAAMADSFEAAGETGPAAFISYLDAKERYGDHTVPAALADEHGGAVRIMSVHASKGLEFPVVALPELGSSGRNDTAMALWEDDGDAVRLAMQLPARVTPDAPSGTRYSESFKRIRETRAAAELEESKRLFYVACTRAREVLVLSGAGSFSKPPVENASAPVEWLRETLGGAACGPEESGRISVGQHECAVRCVDAAEWQAPAPHTYASPATGASSGMKPPPRESAPTVTPPGTGSPVWTHALPDRMSYTDLSLYESCRLKFWALKVMRMNGVRSASDGDPLRLGSAVHAALEVCTPGCPPAPETLASLTRAFDLDEIQSAQLGEAALTMSGSPLAATLGSMDTVRTEWPFAFSVDSAAGPFLMTGSIDAYGRSGTHALVIDYKTGSSGLPSELRDRYALQAQVYALAALLDGCVEVRVSFVRPQVVDGEGHPQELSYDFSARDASRIECDLGERYRDIAKGQFEPLQAWDQHTCAQCPIANGVCPRAPKQR